MRCDRYRPPAGLLAEDDFAGDEADLLTWDDTDLNEAFGIPEVLAPIRLPDEAALTALAGS